MATVEKLTFNIAKEVKDALREERQWYLDAFEAIERAFDGDTHGNESKVKAMAKCRDRMRALYSELGQ